MSAGLWVSFAFTAVFAGPVVSGSDGSSSARPPGLNPAAASSQGPWTASAIAPVAVPARPFLHPRLSQFITKKLSKAIPIAAERLQRRPACRELFESFRADGVETLDRTSYYPAGKKQELRYCRGGTYAATEIGGSAVVLCRRFGRLSHQRAAIVLLHEALHSAGQTESPADPLGPDARHITGTVMKACALSW